MLVRAYESVVLFSGLLSLEPRRSRSSRASRTSPIVLGGASQFTLMQGGSRRLRRRSPCSCCCSPPRPPAIAAVWTMARGRAARRCCDARRRRRRDHAGRSTAKYKFGDDYGYGTYKALLSGGALLGRAADGRAGQPVGALAAAAARRGRRLRRGLGAGDRGRAPAPARREPGLPRGRQRADPELEQLPQDRSCSSRARRRTPLSFQLRMTTGYVAAASTTSRSTDSARRSRTSPAAAPRCGARGGRGATWWSSDAPSAFPAAPAHHLARTRPTGCRRRRRST